MNPRGEQRPLLWNDGVKILPTYGGAKSVVGDTEFLSPAIQRDEEDEIRTLPIDNGTLSKFRHALPQVLATSVQSMLLLSMGMLASFPSVVISALSDKNNNNGFSLSEEDASWYGSFLYFFQPLGAFVNGALLQSIGIKKLTIMLNIPHLVSWLMASFATSTTTLFVANGLAGFVIGLMEAPGMRYISETSHPSIRSILATYSSMFYPTGTFFLYFLSSLTDWRHVAIISASVPIICTIFVFFLPETPVWLISKGRQDDALKSLQWLRGWTSAGNVKDEHKKLQFYSKRMRKTLDIANKRNDQGDPLSGITAITKKDVVHDGTSAVDTINLKDDKYHQQRDIEETWSALVNKDTLVLCGKCTILFFLATFSGRLMLEPYKLNIFEQLHLPINPNTLSILMSIAAMLAVVICMFLIARTGKKPLSIASFAINSVCYLLLGVIITSTASVSEQRWSPVFLFIFTSFVHNLGIQGTMWTYNCEILPYRGRGLTTGIVTSVYYFTVFVGVKVYPMVVQLIGLQGIFFVLGVFCLVGAFFVHFSLPKTDGRFLSDIEIELTHTDGENIVDDYQRPYHDKYKAGVVHSPAPRTTSGRK